MKKKTLLSEEKHEEEYTKYDFDIVEENANPLEFFEEDSDAEFNTEHRKEILRQKKKYVKLNKLFTIKETFDRIGYGFAAHQFINILFFLSGASIFLVGLTHGIKSAVSGLLASSVREYSKLNNIPKRLISDSGILFGFSLIGLILALRIKSSILFAIFLLMGSFGIVTYGELYDRLLKEGIKFEKKNKFLQNITHIGLIITAVSFFISGVIIEFVGIKSHQINLLGYSFPITGYFIVFEFSAIIFILTGFILSKIPLKQVKPKINKFRDFLKIYFLDIRLESKKILHDKNLSLIFLGAMLLSVIEVLGGSYFGYVVYETFKNSFFHGFFNVAIVFGIAIFASFLGPLIITFFKKEMGLTPLFVFGTLLVAIFPLTLVFNPYFFAVIAAASCSVVGSSILGVAQSLLARKLLSPSKRKIFFNSIELFLVIPFLILVPIGALIASLWSFKVLFVLMSIVLIFVISPLYFILVLRANRKKL